MNATGPHLMHGDVRVELGRFVSQSIRELGWVRPAAAAWLADMIGEFADAGAGRAIRRAGVRVEATGVSREVWEALTDSGRRDPAARFDAVVNYVLRLAVSAARWQQIERMAADRPFIRCVAVLDNNTGPECAARHDIVLPLGHAWWHQNRPPHRWDCRCTVQTLNERDLVRYGLKVSAAPPELPLTD